jgi:RING finger protein 113A
MSTTTGEQVTVPFFKKKSKGRPTTTRKRSASPTVGPTAVDTSTGLTSKSARKRTSNLLSAGTKRTASQRDGLDDIDAPERDGPDVKWTAAGSHLHAALDILAGDEAEELANRNSVKKSKIPKAMRVGPQRSTSTIRTVTIVDYQPDVCKDYKETGYCGFGDTCKFLHDRGTYLAGWQLDKLAETAKKQVEDESDADDSDEDVPFACLICRKHYTDPVVTRCGHYFCSSCAIKRYAKTPKCLACGAPTGGIFNRADKVIDRVNKKRKEKEEKEVDDSEINDQDVQIQGLETD